MSRVIAGCGVVVDTLLGGLSLFGGEQSWTAAIILGVFTLFMPLVLFVGTFIAEASEQPDVLPALQPCEDWFPDQAR